MEMDAIYPVPQTENEKNAFSNETSQIKKHFANSTIFVTGGTGFLGSLLVEKFLRSCPDLKRIYLLMRAKKGIESETRFKQYFDRPFFEPLLKENPKVVEKVFIVLGDCALPDLGLNEQDRNILISEVNTIIHLAATVRFDEKLRVAANINVRATQDVIRLSKEVKNLDCVVHVSTAFSNCPSKHIDEVFYPTKFTGAQLLSLVDSLDDDMLQELQNTILGEWPNTYAFTKIIAEDVVKNESGNLPVAIVRPSIVVGTVKEPIPGWIDNFYGAAGVFVGAGIGLLRTLHCKRDNVAEIVPADYVINNIIATAWNTGATKKTQLTIEECETKKNTGCDIPIYNYVSGFQNPITWGESLDLGFSHGEFVPTVLQVWHPFLLLTPYKPLQLIFHYLLHIIPSYIADFLAFCVGKPRQLVKAYQKITKFLGAIEYFSCREWTIEDNNTQSLWKKLNPSDQKEFEFDIKKLNWNSYIFDFLKGLRVYLVKDPLSTIPEGLKKRRRIKIAHYAICTLLGFLFFRFLFWIAITVVNRIFDLSLSSSLII